jgi:TonB-dependent receptor
MGTLDMRLSAASYRRALLCGTISAFAFSAAPAFAQSSDEQGGDFGGADIVVTGSIRQSQEAAIATKREAANFVDVASADSIGRFPDESTAAALARLPGVAVQRDQGQARYIQVRGAPNRWTSVSIDGIPQTGVDEGGDSRAYRFDAVPAVLLQQLVINKSLTPDLTAEAITANVDLRTYSPLTEYGFKANGDIGYGFMDLGGGQQRQGSLRLSWSNDIIGVAVGASHYLRDQVTDNREAGYDEFGPTDIDIRSYKLERSNNGLFGVLEAQATENLKLYARGIYTEFTDKEQRNAYEIELADAASGTRGLTSGDLVGVPVTANFNSGTYENQNYIGSVGFNYEDMNGWGVDGALGYTRTKNTTDLPLVQGATRGLASPSLTYDRSADPRFPIVTLYQTVADSAGNLSRGAELSRFDQTAFNWPASFLIPLLQGTVSDAYTGKLDGWRQLGDITLKTGGLLSVRKIAGNNLGAGGIVPLGPLGFNFTQYLTDQPWDTQFPLGIEFNYMDNVALNDELQAALTEAGFDAASFIPPTSMYDQEETILAGYAMGQLDLDRLLLTAGVRVEHYKVDNSGTTLIDRVPTPLSVSQDHFDVFPSVNARFNVSDNLVFRLSGQRGVSRPAYAAIRVGSSISDIGEAISGGNPQLLPEYTWGADGSLEYYFSSNGIASIAGFYRSVDNVLYQSQRPVGTNIYNTEGVDRSDYLLTSTFNGENGKLYGVEFNIEHQFDFLPGLLSGLGVQANLTLLAGEFDARQPDGTVTKAAFQGLSDTVLNTSLFYEYAGLSARVSYQWRSDYLDTIGGLGAGEFRDAYENLDITLRYALNENLTLFADLANLTDETYVAYEGSAATPSEVERIGERYLFGVRFNF